MHHTLGDFIPEPYASKYDPNRACLNEPPLRIFQFFDRPEGATINIGLFG